MRGCSWTLFFTGDISIREHKVSQSFTSYPDEPQAGFFNLVSHASLWGTNLSELGRFCTQQRPQLSKEKKGFQDGKKL